MSVSLRLPFRRVALWLVVLAGFTTGVLASTDPETGTTMLPDSHRLPSSLFSTSDDAFLDELERAAFRFFVEQSHPVTGLVLDRAHADGSPRAGKASIAASGFALSAWAIGAERGWIERAEAVSRCRRQLRFLAEKAPRVHGFFYHFMEPDTGAKAWQCELSTIDTGLFMAGAIMAREYFHDPEITSYVNQLYGDLDWSWFLNGGSTFAMGWHDETGFSRFRWSAYSELMMLTMLGVGAEKNPVSPDLWSAWERGPAGDYAGYHYIQYPSLFVHQFTHAYVRFRGQRDAYADYYRNSVLATLAQRRFCADLAGEFPTWSERLWGITASDSASGYKGGWGGPPRTLGSTALDGTLAPCAAAGSLPFTPIESLITLQHMRTAYGDRIWQRYGFVDAFNPENGWVNPDVIGIDVGIELLQAENARTDLVHRVFMQAPEVQRALHRTGFLSYDRNLPTVDRARILSLARSTWATLAQTPLAADTAGLQLSAVVAARALGFLTGTEATSQVAALLGKTTAPANAAALAEYAAGLVLLRQAFPAIAPEVGRRLAGMDWSKVSVEANQLGSLDRLADFFQIASGAKPASAWMALARASVWLKPVYVLSPATLRDQLIPGLWLDERSIITGASAAQLTYAQAVSNGAPATPRVADLLSLAALIEHFPSVAAKALTSMAEQGFAAGASVEDRTALMLAAANLLSPESIRSYFQKDPLVQAGRAAIPDFGAAEFGAMTSTYWRRELAGPRTVPPPRVTVASPSSTPRDQWHWFPMQGLEFKDSAADTRPGDPELSMRFAFTWDNDALYLHADVIDALPAVVPKPGEHSGVELFVDPKREGFTWLGDGSYQFVYRTDGTIREAFHHRATTAEMRPMAGGYSVDARIPWSELGLTPHPGLEIAVSPAVISEGRAEWEPALKLNWQYFHRADDRIGLGTLRLE